MRILNIVIFFLIKETKWIEIANNLAELFLQGESNKIGEKELNDFKSWHTNVKLVFLGYLINNKERINQNVYELLRDKLNLHTGYNTEISYSWYQICLDLNKEDAIEDIKKFLACNGRMKYIKATYLKLYDFNRYLAVNLFEENK